MFVEIDVFEDTTGLSSYSGEASDADIALIVEGKFTKPFLRLDHVFLNITKRPKEEWEETKRLLGRWGYGEYQNYVGQLFTRVDRIVHIAPLKEVALRSGAKKDEA